MRRHAKAASAGSAENGISASPLGLVALCAAALLLVGLIGASAAQAANSYVPSGEISAGELTGPARIAVDETTGNVLVVDTAKNRVDVFDSSGPGAALLTTFGEGDLSGPYGIAIDQASGDVYVTDPGNEQILRYETDGEPTPAYSLDAGYTGPAAGSGSEEVGSFASAIAVDPTNADLLVADRGNDRVSRFSTTGAFVSSFDGADSTDGPFTHLEDVILSPAGKIFVVDGIAGESSRVLRFSNAGAFEATLREPAATGDAYLAYNSARPGLIVGDARECFFCPVQVHVLDPTSGAVLFNVAVPSESITGLAVDPGSGRLYAASFRGEFFASPKVAVLASQMHPELVLDAPTPVSPFSVHLSGTVDPEGVATEYHFEVSKDGGTNWQKSPDASAGVGTSPVAVEADLAVEPNTSYVAKLVTSNTEGAQDATPTQPFLTAVTAPATVTRPATDLAETSATINGTINPYGLQTTYYFEYGPTTAYGTKVPAGIENTAGQGRVPKAFSREISGLAPGATYHFRLVATSSAGTAEGSDQSFTTLAAGAVPARAYEQVTPVEKGEMVVIPWLLYQASADGNAVSYTTKTSPQTTPIVARWVAFRGTSDWGKDTAIDLPTNQPEGESGLFSMTALAISNDFEHAFGVTNRALTPGAIEGGANLYRIDIATGDYRLIGAANGSGSFNEFVGAQMQGKFQGGAPDFSWIVFASPAPLLPGAPNRAIYRWSESDGLEIVSVLPNGEMTSALIASAISTYHPISDDGSRIYFTAYGGAEEGVFLREGNGPAKPVSVSQVPGDPSTPRPATLLGVNRDGGRFAFFASQAKLTSDAPGTGTDLYRYDASDGSIEYLGAEPFLSGDSGKLDLGTGGIGADGQTIYFRSLDGPSAGDFKVWHDGEIHTVFPGVLGAGREHPSPNGRYFVGNQTIEGVPGVIQLYDAETDQHICVTCLPDGTPVPGRLPPEGEMFISNRNPQAVDDKGTVYFDTTARLVTADVNGTRDVYTFRDGGLTLVSPGDRPFEASYADSSEDGSSVFFNTSQKLVGRDNDRSIDLYVSRVNGGLPAQNPPPPSQECAGDDCRPAPGAGQEAPAGGSEALSGPGNVKPAKKKAHCGKGKRKVKAKGRVNCVKKKAGKNKKGGSR